MNTALSKQPAAQALPDHPPAAVLSWQGHMAEDGGSTFGPTPCATLSATSTELCLRGTRGEFHVPRSAVSKIGRGRLYPWFFCAIQIHHAVPRCSRELQFKPMGTPSREVFEQLRKLGYPVR